jgi:hypothetical protein
MNTTNAMLYSCQLQCKPENLTHDFALNVWKFYNETAKGLLQQFNRCIYFGAISTANCAHGIGILFFSNGYVYVGNFNQLYKNAMHGYGILFFGSQKTYYEGSFENNRRFGKGTLIYNSKLSYSGDWCNDKPQGKGYQVTPTFHYDGDFLNGAKHGVGITTYTNGVIYYGQYQNDSRCGEGKLIYPHFHKYQCGSVCSHAINGTWKDDECENGTLHCGSSLYTYTGQFKGFNPHGKGMFHYQFGQMYCGEVKEGLPDGFGTRRMSNGDILQGTFSKGKCNGNAVYTFLNGGVFAGQWKNNVCPELADHIKHMINNGTETQINRYREGYSQLAKFVNSLNSQTQEIDNEEIILTDSDDDDEDIIKQSAERSCLKGNLKTPSNEKTVRWFDEI